MSSPAVPARPSTPVPYAHASKAGAHGRPMVGRSSFHAALTAARPTPPPGTPAKLASFGVAAGLPARSGEPPKAAVAARQESGREVETTLDPLERHAAHLAPPGFVSAPPPVVAAVATAEAAPVALCAASLETLLPALVRRIAWSAEGKDRGAVRMEIGAGELQGAVLLVQADAGEVKIHVSVPGGADREAWREKLLRRLDARGVRVTSLEIE